MSIVGGVRDYCLFRGNGMESISREVEWMISGMVRRLFKRRLR